MSRGQVRKLTDLVPDPENRRKHNPRNIAMVVDALQSVGAARSIVIDEDNVVLAGNGVVEAAAAAGITKLRVIEADGQEVIAVRRSGLTAEQKRSLAIFDNRAGELAEWNVDQLVKDGAAELDLKPFFTDQELRRIVGPDKPSGGNTDADDVPAIRRTDIRRGDVFELGRHRLICGDSTSDEDVARVVVPDADLCFTSPPYGAGKSARLRKHYVPGREMPRSHYESHDDAPESWATLMSGWFNAVRPRVQSVICNVQMLADNKCDLIEWMFDRRSDLCDVIVWDKGHAAPQMAANILSNVFEWLIVFGSGGSRSIPFGAFHGTVHNVIRINPLGLNEYAAVHRAVFPVALPLWVMNDLCPLAKSVVEPFCGSGTTIIAAEQLGRACYAIELEPAYVQVAIDRWEAFTGKTAVKVGDAARS